MGSQYTEMHIEWNELLLTIETTVVSKRDLLIAVQVVNNDSQAVNLSNYFVLVNTNYLFYRQGVCISANYCNFVNCTGIGLSNIQFFAIQPQIKISKFDVKHTTTSNNSSSSVHQQKHKIQDLFSSDSEIAAFSLTGGAIGFSSNTFRNLIDIQRSIANARADELQNYQKYGPELSENYRAIHNVIAWNTIYTVYEGVINVVSRRWDFGFGYVMFLWDSFLTSLIRSFDIDGLDVALQTFIQVAKSRTRNIDSTGLLPNYKSGTRISRDRTEPPIGSIMLLQLVKIQKTENLTWFIDLIYPELYANLVWMWKHRMMTSKIHPNISLLVLGSDPDNLPINGDIEVNNLQAARFESGLDNSPMYDYDDFDNKMHKMLQFDIGMNSLFAAEAEALIQLIKYSSLSLVEEYKTLQYWLSMIVPAIESELWNLNASLYLNRAVDTGEFNIHISPTSFFPLLIGLPSVKQAEKMIVQYLTNSSHFCVSSDCHEQPLPSISRSDSAYSDQNYWRGRVWGPHSYIVYTALSHSNYALSEIIQYARNSLINQTDLMWRKEWNLYGHIHENYHGDTGAGCGSNSDPFYTWGAATAFLSIIRKYSYQIRDDVTFWFVR
ncbi:unnamed protein product [Didymodactylos carnosus]|uniref:Mannosylglycerate hydrolase MGH1-like glycoside hydrolase domain-containing protein n=1 Tax=Didymodactylos carnosus TaxID=1234261 RepID=A0A814EBL1_9BILA|nr:unnamed protein product [Didymodactylos carnosus]CAF3743068.1 unnamed protein product [Didymodactylos carnosus]